MGISEIFKFEKEIPKLQNIHKQTLDFQTLLKIMRFKNDLLLHLRVNFVSKIKQLLGS